MQIDIKGRNVPVNDEIRTHAVRRLDKVARQVSEFARVEIEVFKEPNPRVSDCHVAEATLYLKGVTLRARDRSPEMLHSLNLIVDELARQVKAPPLQTPPPARGAYSRRRPSARRRSGARGAARDLAAAARAATQSHSSRCSRRAAVPAGCCSTACAQRLSLAHAISARSCAERR
jgi:putative sigma-54 modulation protein